VSDVDRYFASKIPADVAPDAGRYIDLSDVAPVEFVQGLVFRPILTDEQMVNFVHYEPGTVVPEHAHAEQQITFVLDGEFEFTLGGELRTLRPGTVAVIPSWVPHAARTLGKSCLQVDVFVPPRAVLAEVLRRDDAASTAE
jgi:quercetin dioxygenase-like cupin family protein